MCASYRQTPSKDRDGEGTAVHKHLLSCGDHAWDHENDSVKRKRAQTRSRDRSYDTESSGCDESSTSSISSARERHVGNDFRAPNFARDRDRDID